METEPVWTELEERILPSHDHGSSKRGNGRGSPETSYAESCNHAARGGAMSERKGFSLEEARRVGKAIGIDWDSVPFEIEQFRAGMDVELEHGLRDPTTNVTDDDPLVTGKIALAHLKEFSDYYIRLEHMEVEARRAASPQAGD
jgi:hypothetical protein